MTVYRDVRTKLKSSAPLTGNSNTTRSTSKVGVPSAEGDMEEERALSTEQFVERARKRHGQKFDYSKVEYQQPDKDDICPIHGEFEQLPQVTREPDFQNVAQRPVLMPIERLLRISSQRQLECMARSTTIHWSKRSSIIGPTC